MGFFQPDAGHDYRPNEGEVIFGMTAGPLSLPWLLLIAAGVCEIVWAVGLKYSEGFTRLLPSAITAGFMVASVWWLSVALRSIPVGTGYAVWTGIGAVGTAICGMILFDESRAVIRLLCMVMIVAGIVGLKVFASGESS